VTFDLKLGLKQACGTMTKP